MPAAKQLPEAPSKITARNAAHSAAEYFRELYPTTRSFSLEEVELSEDGRNWLVTLSFEVLPPTAPARANLSVLFNAPLTKYKVFKVNVRTGEVVSMRIRKLE